MVYWGKHSQIEGGRSTISGHSKWSTIKRQKAKTDAARGAVFTKLSREIILAAKVGGGDPTGNFRLRTAIEKARSSGMPQDNIKRAVAKGSGGGEGTEFDEIRYEGYGPGGVAVMVEAQTDNRNRTAADIRSAFSKNGGNLGETGCVGWMFTEKGQILISNEDGEFGEDDLMLVAVEAGADDLINQGESYEILTPPEQLEEVQNALSKAGYPIESADLAFVPSNNVEVTDPEIAKKLLKMVDALEELDDVKNVWSNSDFADGILEALA